MLVAEVGGGDVAGVEEVEEGVDAVDRGEDVAGVASLGDGVHVADGEADGGGGGVDGGEDGGHGVGAGVAANGVDEEGDVLGAGGLLDEGVEVGGGDGTDVERKTFTHHKIGEATVGDAGGRAVVVVHIDGDDDVGFEFSGEDAAAHATDLFVGGEGELDADVGGGVGGAGGEEAGDFGDGEAAEAVVEVGAEEGVGGEAALDGAVEEEGVAGFDAEGFDLGAAFVAVELEFEVKLVCFYANFAFAQLGGGEVDGTEGFDGAAFDGAVGAGGVGEFAEEGDFVAEEGLGEEGVGVDPDLAVVANAANLEADFIGVTDQHNG